jgi:hypothetical protein
MCGCAEKKRKWFAQWILGDHTRNQEDNDAIVRRQRRRLRNRRVLYRIFEKNRLPSNYLRKFTLKLPGESRLLHCTLLLFIYNAGSIIVGCQR